MIAGLGGKAAHASGMAHRHHAGRCLCGQVIEDGRRDIRSARLLLPKVDAAADRVWELDVAKVRDVAKDRAAADAIGKQEG